MNYTIAKQKNWHTVIHVTVPGEVVKPKLEENFDEYQKTIKLEGFRKGKVPAQLIKKMFGKQIEKDTFHPYFNEAWKKVTEENEFDFLCESVIDNVVYNDEDGLSFTIEFDERPNFVVTGFDDLPVEQVTFDVTDDDVKRTLENLQQRNAMIYSVDGEAKEDHILLTDLQETDSDGVPVIGSKYPGQQIFLDKANEELTGQLVGIKAGEERRIILTQQSKEEGAEPTPPQHFIVSVKEVKERRVPELDDEFAKDLGAFNALADLKKDIKERLKQQAVQTAEMQFKRDLIDELIKKMDIEVPPSMLETYMNALVRDFKKSNGADMRLDDKQIKDYYYNIAVRTIKWILIREKLVEQQNITISDEEVEKRIATLKTDETQPDHQGEHDHDHEEEVNDEEIKNKMLEEKVYEFLISKAKIKKVKKPWRQETEAVPETE